MLDTLLTQVRRLFREYGRRNVPHKRDVVESSLICDGDINIPRNRILYFDEVHAPMVKHIDRRPCLSDVFHRDECRHLEW